MSPTPQMADLVNKLSGITAGGVVLYWKIYACRIVRSIAADLRISRIVRTIMTVTGFAGTAALLFITWNPRPGGALSNLCSPVSQQALFNGFLRGREQASNPNDRSRAINVGDPPRSHDGPFLPLSKRARYHGAMHIDCLSWAPQLRSHQHRDGVGN